MSNTIERRGGQIIWVNVITVISAAILIGAEVFGAAFAAGWAFANLFGLGEYGVHILQGAVLRARRRRDDLVHPQRQARRAVHDRPLSAPRSRNRHARHATGTLRGVRH